MTMRTPEYEKPAKRRFWMKSRVGMWIDRVAYPGEVVVDYKPALGEMRELGCILITQHTTKKTLNERFVQFPRYLLPDKQKLA